MVVGVSSGLHCFIYGTGAQVEMYQVRWFRQQGVCCTHTPALGFVDVWKAFCSEDGVVNNRTLRVGTFVISPHVVVIRRRLWIMWVCLVVRALLYEHFSFVNMC